MDRLRPFSIAPSRGDVSLSDAEGRVEGQLVDYLCEYPPAFFTADLSRLEGRSPSTGTSTDHAFALDAIEAVDWATAGIDPLVEKPNGTPSGNSIFEWLQAEALRVRDALGPDRKKGYDEVVRKLTRGGAISATEERALLDLGKRGFAVVSDADFEKFRSYTQSMHQKMLRDSKTGPVALAIVGVIGNYAVPPPARSGPEAARILAAKSGHPVRDILLGVAGGAFGGLMMSGWNPIGGVVGGLVGGIVSGLKGLC